MGFGRTDVSSEIRVPMPPARMTDFTIPPACFNARCSEAALSLRTAFLTFRFHVKPDWELPQVNLLVELIEIPWQNVPYEEKA
jgi:hypothetical protein